MKRFFTKTSMFVIVAIMTLSINVFAAALTPLETATQYVQIAEQYKSGVGTVQAATAIAALPDGPDKQALSARLQAVNDYVYQQKIVTATNAVVAAEKANNATMANNSLAYVALLNDGAVKDSLIQRVYAITSTPVLATKQVEYVETTKDTISFKRAQMYVNGLADGIGLDAMMSPSAVKVSLTTTSLSTLTVPTAPVTAPVAEVKEVLQERLNAIQLK